MADALLPPESVRGMTCFDKTVFTKKIRVPILIIKEMSISFVIVVLKPYLLKMENFKPVQVDQSDSKLKLVFLNPVIVTDFNSIKHETREVLLEYDISCNSFQYRDVTLTFDNWKCHEIINALLPPKLSFSGFSVIGSIIHLNLKEQLFPYKHAIGAVLLEKMKICQSVVCKVKSIDTLFRNFEMEILAGSQDLKTEVKENGCRFALNFGEVFWNPRLHDEHGRIVRKLSEGDVLYDVFCGIGPFAIPAARSGCEVLANDLNPACCKWLKQNMAINKVCDQQLRIFNKSGDEFIRKDVREDLLKRTANADYKCSKFHVTMNLPKIADIFLPSFVGLFDDNELSTFTDSQLPVVHFYCFMKNQQHPEVEARKLVENVLNTCLPSTTEVFNVRNVAPNKEMIRVSFVLSKDILGNKRENVKRVHDEESNLTEMNQTHIDGMEWECNGSMNSDDDTPVKRSKYS